MMLINILVEQTMKQHPDIDARNENNFFLFTLQTRLRSLFTHAFSIGVIHK